MNIICDTDIVSSLAKVEELDLLDEIFPRSNFYISLAVYEELDNAREMGHNFPEKIFKKFQIVSMVEDEVKRYRRQISGKRILDRGEIQSMVIAQSRDWIFLTNDKVARVVSKESSIKTYNLAEILRASFLAGLRSEKELKELIKSLKERDNFVFSNETNLYE
ncbi:MAG: hypothetical protein R6U61_09435 [Thermoplasmata archaeon]